MISDPSGGPSMRVKRWHEVAPEEAPQVLTSQAAFVLLKQPANQELARKIHGDIRHQKPDGKPIPPLDDKSWEIVRKAFEKHKYVLVSPVRPPDQKVDWSSIPMSLRNAYVMKLLVEKYKYPANGAAGLVGNLDAESGLIPNRIEGTKASEPMHAPTFGGTDPKTHKPMKSKDRRDWTPEQIRDRDYAHRIGPFSPGIGIAQWTSADRREGLFNRNYGGHNLGVSILSNMDAQVAYLVSELKKGYTDVDQVLLSEGVSVDFACDTVHYDFERPKSLRSGGKKRPMTDIVKKADKDRLGRPTKAVTVQDLVDARRRNARKALRDYQDFNQNKP
jgi:hypothetical protein